MNYFLQRTPKTSYHGTNQTGSAINIMIKVNFMHANYITYSMKQIKNYLR